MALALALALELALTLERALALAGRSTLRLAQWTAFVA